MTKHSSIKLDVYNLIRITETIDGEVFAIDGVEPMSAVPVGLIAEGELEGTPIRLPFGCGFLNFEGGVQKSGFVSCMLLVPTALTDIPPILVSYEPSQ